MRLHSGAFKRNAKASMLISMTFIHSYISLVCFILVKLVYNVNVRTATGLLFTDYHMLIFYPSSILTLTFLCLAGVMLTVFTNFFLVLSLSQINVPVHC